MSCENGELVSSQKSLSAIQATNGDLFYLVHLGSGVTGKDKSRVMPVSEVKTLINNIHEELTFISDTLHTATVSGDLVINVSNGDDHKYTLNGGVVQNISVSGLTEAKSQLYCVFDVSGQTDGWAWSGVTWAHVGASGDPDITTRDEVHVVIKKMGGTVYAFDIGGADSA